MINFNDYYSLEQLQFIAYTLAILLMLATVLFFAGRAIFRALRRGRWRRKYDMYDRIKNVANDHKDLWDLFTSVNRRTDKHAELTSKRLDDIEATLRTILPKPAKKTKASQASPRK